MVFPVRYRVLFKFRDGNTWEGDTPYRFMPILGEQDLYFFNQGKHYDLYEKMGAHFREVDGVEGVSFAVWAPNASRVSVIGGFNKLGREAQPHEMHGCLRRLGAVHPGLIQGELYKYEIKTAAGDLRIKTDPFAFCMELRPETAGLVWNLDNYQWNDSKWMEDRKTRNLQASP